MTQFFINEKILNDFNNILKNENIDFSDYNITKSDFKRFIITKKSSIRIAKKFYKFYNEYYKTNYSFDELFDSRYLN
jgi:hypothetical protein